MCRLWTVLTTGSRGFGFEKQRRKAGQARMDARASKKFFDTFGYLVVEDALSTEEVRQCQEEVSRLHQQAAGEADPLSGSSFQWEPFAGGKLSADNLPILRKVEGTGDLSPLFRGLPQHPKILRTWQNLIGDDDLLLFRSTLMLKPAQHGSAHALHQDSA